MASVATTVLLGGDLVSKAVAAVLCILLGLIAIACRGLERVRIGNMRAPIGYGITSLVSIVIVLIVGAQQSPIAACVAAAGVLGVLLALLSTTA